MKSSQTTTMKLLNKIKDELKLDTFNIEFESEMVQSRILSSFLEVIDEKGLTQTDLEKLTGLTQPFISALFNNRRKLNVEHIALFQEALKIVLQPPTYLSKEEHTNKFYTDTDYCFNENIFSVDNFISQMDLDFFPTDKNDFIEEQVVTTKKSNQINNQLNVLQYAY